MILFDLTKTQPRGNSKYHGGGKYGVVFFKSYAIHYPKDIIAYYDKNNYIDESVLKVINDNHIQTYYKNEENIDTIISRLDCIVYSPLYSGDYRKARIAVVTIHGLRLLEMPYDRYEYCFKDKRNVIQTILMKLGLNELREMIIDKWYSPKHICHERKICSYDNVKFITVSNHSKSSLLNFVPTLRKEDIKVFYSPSTVDDSIDISDYVNPYGRYYMLVSGNRWLKNPVRAIKAFDELFSERSYLDFKVVITGLDSLSSLALDVKNKNRFICLGYVSETQLKCLYHHAYALVYPSLNEGFGYPPLEAMHEGCPVISSAIASIPEVCGDAVLYFNPYLIEEIKMRILMMEDRTIRNDYMIRGGKRQSYIQQIQDRHLEELCEYLHSIK